VVAAPPCLESAFQQGRKEKGNKSPHEPDSFQKAFPREGVEWVVREGVGAGGRNDPSVYAKIKLNI
jgi:hypothetical protein